jgi:hypothetical protein
MTLKEQMDAGKHIFEKIDSLFKENRFQEEDKKTDKIKLFLHYSKSTCSTSNSKKNHQFSKLQIMVCVDKTKTKNNN